MNEALRLKIQLKEALKIASEKAKEEMQHIPDYVDSWKPDEAYYSGLHRAAKIFTSEIQRVMK